MTTGPWIQEQGIPRNTSGELYASHTAAD